MTATLALIRIGKVFEGAARQPVVALQDVSLTLAEGEFVSVVGASGSGKSTLLRIVDGLIAPSWGEVLLDGTPVTGPGSNRAVVFQQDRLFPWLTVRDNVAYGLRTSGVRRRLAGLKADRYLELTGLSRFAAHFPRQLSGGMRQRANLARALAVEPRILLLDEPFASLDGQTREIMQSELLKIWSADRRTVLFITHQIDEAVYLSDRVVVFSPRPGRIKAEIPIDLPRPRSLGLKRTAEFGALVDRIWDLIETDVRRSLDEETST